MANENEKKDKKPKKNVFKALRGEFKKIVWPTKDTVTRETISVVASTVFLGVIIACMDGLIKMLISFVTTIGA
ncbi:MAG: preprotein translocase subunit SecE [Lachnospiraceae bacterium]|nr:preprotein translocase subunit SecE [Lachnospiraceae bacterium]